MSPVLKTLVWLLIVLSSLSLASWACADADPPTVSLEVRLTTPSGSAPEAGVPVTATLCRGNATTALTSASGVAAFTLQLPSGCEWIRITIDQLSFQSKNATANAKNQDRVLTLEGTWSVPPPVELRIDAAQSAYIFDLELAPAITVTGKVAGLGGERRGVRVDRDGRFNMGMVLGRVSGKFEVLGVPKGRDSLLYMWVENRAARAMWIRIQELTAAQTQQSVDLGTIVDDPPTETVTTTVTVTEFRTPPPNRFPYARLMVALRSDGKYAVPLHFAREADAQVPAAQSLSFTAKVPVGTWYIFPSEIEDLRIVPAIRRLLSGDSAAIDAANIPKVVVTPGQPPAPAPSVTIDFWPTLERMLTITPPPPPPPPPAPPAP